jgi:hypothetical protein
MSSGAIAVIAAEPRTKMSALTRLTSHPVIKFVKAPVKTKGRKRTDVWIGDSD